MGNRYVFTRCGHAVCLSNTLVLNILTTIWWSDTIQTIRNITFTSQVSDWRIRTIWDGISPQCVVVVACLWAPSQHCNRLLGFCINLKHSPAKVQLRMTAYNNGCSAIYFQIKPCNGCNGLSTEYKPDLVYNLFCLNLRPNKKKGQKQRFYP